jgi:hypothetical protein
MGWSANSMTESHDDCQKGKKHGLSFTIAWLGIMTWELDTVLIIKLTS